jgi:3-oxoadipate enol-lactonase
LLFLNGTGGDLRQKPNPLEWPLARHFEMLAFDQRGLGQSDKPNCSYSMADYAADALALMDHVGWSSARVLGVSFGGMVAQELAVTAPERVERLVLACTSPGGAGGASYPLHEMHRLPPAEQARIGLELLDARGASAGPELLALAAEMAKRRAAIAPEPGAEEGARRQLEARAGHDCWDRLPRLAMPVLIAAGRYDAMAPLANQRAMASRIPNAQLEIFEGGHVFFLQDPRALPAIEAFLRADAEI